MAPSRRYLDRDLFELGYANQKMIERVHGFWDAQLCRIPREEGYDQEDCILPSLLRQYVLDVCSRLRHLAKKKLGERNQSQATNAESLLARAWRKYQGRWKRLTGHKLQQAQATIWEYQNTPQELTGSPLATKEWTEYTQALGSLFAAIEERVAHWAELGSLVAQVETLWGAKQPKILGEPFPLPALQDALRDARDSDSALADVDVELSDAETNVHGFPELEHVKPKVESIRKVILDRLAGYSTTIAPESEAAPKTKDRKGHCACSEQIKADDTRTKQSTAKGDARAKIIAALTLHHKYHNGGCSNLEYIGVSALARLAETAKSTVSDFFEHEFGGHRKYKGAFCSEPGILAASLRKLNDEYSCDMLFGLKLCKTSDRTESDKDK